MLKELSSPINITRLPNNNMVKIQTLGDGNCFFHALLCGTSEEYRKGDLTKKRELVMEYKNMIGDEFSEEFYKSLSSGNILDYASITTECSYEGLKSKIMRNGENVDNYMIETLARLCEHNIILLTVNSGIVDLYKGAIVKEFYAPNAGFIFILYNNNHYELVAEVLDDISMRTIFDKKNSVIRSFIDDI